MVKYKNLVGAAALDEDSTSADGAALPIAADDVHVLDVHRIPGVPSMNPFLLIDAAETSPVNVVAVAAYERLLVVPLRPL